MVEVPTLGFSSVDPVDIDSTEWGRTKSGRECRRQRSCRQRGKVRRRCSHLRWFDGWRG